MKCKEVTKEYLLLTQFVTFGVNYSFGPIVCSNLHIWSNFEKIDMIGPRGGSTIFGAISELKIWSPFVPTMFCNKNKYKSEDCLFQLKNSQLNKKINEQARSHIHKN